MKRIILTALSALVFTASASAQDKAPPKILRFLPLGELPVWKEELRDGVRVQLPPAPGALPPKTITYLSGTELKTVNLSLRAMTEKVTLAAATEGLLIKGGEGDTAPQWFSKPLPAVSPSLAVLYRNNTTMTWEKPDMMMLPDDRGSFPPGQMRFVNLSDKLVIILIGDPDAKPKPRPFGLAPGKSVMKPLETGKTQIMVGYRTANGGQKAIWTNEVRLLGNQRIQCFFYKAQSPPPADAVKFHFLPEVAPR